MSNSIQFPYSQQDAATGTASLLPYLPIKLSYQNKEVDTEGLLDTGSTVNVLPYDLGVQLGGIWDNQQTSIQLTGNLANFEARAILLTGHVGNLSPVHLAFAWTKADNVPLILGQINFFMEFDICFYRARELFEIRPKTTP